MPAAKYRAVAFSINSNYIDEKSIQCETAIIEKVDEITIADHAPKRGALYVLHSTSSHDYCLLTGSGAGYWAWRRAHANEMYQIVVERLCSMTVRVLMDRLPGKLLHVYFGNTDGKTGELNLKKFIIAA